MHQTPDAHLTLYPRRQQFTGLGTKLCHNNNIIIIIYTHAPCLPALFTLPLTQLSVKCCCTHPQTHHASVCAGCVLPAQQGQSLPTLPTANLHTLTSYDASVCTGCVHPSQQGQSFRTCQTPPHKRIWRRNAVRSGDREGNRKG